MMHRGSYTSDGLCANTMPELSIDRLNLSGSCSLDTIGDDSLAMA